MTIVICNISDGFIGLMITLYSTVLKFEFRLPVSVKFHIAHLYEVQGKYRLAKEHYEALLKEKALPSHLKADICRQLGKSEITHPNQNFLNIKKKRKKTIHHRFHTPILVTHLYTSSSVYHSNLKLPISNSATFSPKQLSC